MRTYMCVFVNTHILIHVCMCVCNLLNLINAAYIFGKADLSGLITIYDAYLWGRKSPPLSRSFSRDGTPGDPPPPIHVGLFADSVIV